MKMKNKALGFYFTLLLVSIVLLAGCKSQIKPKVGFLVPNMTSDRYGKELKYFSEKLAELGGEMISASADNDDKLQIKQAKDLILQGARVLVVNSVNLATAAAIVRYAHDHKVKVIAYDRLILNSSLDYYLSFDNKKVGRLMAEYVIKIKQSGKYMLVCGDKTDLNASLVKDGQMEVLKPLISSGNIKIVFDEFIEDWSGVNAGHEVKRYCELTGDTPEVILSSFDGMSTGIIAYFQTINLAGQVLITGQDAELAACRNIVKGYQAMTVYKSLKKLAFRAAEMSMDLVNSRSITGATSKVSNGLVDVSAILLDAVSVDKNNIKSTIIADGYLKEAEVFQ